MTPELLALLTHLLTVEGAPDTITHAALEAVGNLAFAVDNRRLMAGQQVLMGRVLQLINAHPLSAENSRPALRNAAIRVLAVLGNALINWLVYIGRAH